MARAAPGRSREAPRPSGRCSPAACACAGGGPTPYPGIELPATFEDYLAGLPRKRRKDLRRHLRRLEDGRLELRHVTEPADLLAAMDRWQDIRVRWWQHRGKQMDPEHASTRFRDFMRDLMVLMVPRGLAEVWELRNEGEVVGVEVNLADRRAYYSWMGAYDPGVSHLGLGKLAIGESIRESIEAGREYYDLMVGDEDYKYWYGATDRHCRWTMAGSGRPLSRLALAAGSVADRARRVAPPPGYLRERGLTAVLDRLADAAAEPVVPAQEVGDPVPVHDHGLADVPVGLDRHPPVLALDVDALALLPRRSAEGLHVTLDEVGADVLLTRHLRRQADDLVALRARDVAVLRAIARCRSRALDLLLRLGDQLRVVGGMIRLPAAAAPVVATARGRNRQPERRREGQNPPSARLTICRNHASIFSFAAPNPTGRTAGDAVSRGKIVRRINCIA